MSSPGSSQSFLEPVTVEWLTEVLRTEVLKKSQKWPRKEDIVHLVRVVNNISAAYYLDNFRILRSKVFIDFKYELKNYSSRYAKENEARPTEDVLAAASRRFVYAADELTKLLAEYGPRDLSDGAIVSGKPKDWHDIAGSIATHFIYSPAGRGFGINNKEGAVARFVCVLIPQITGDSPTLGAVGKYLSRLADEAKKTNRDNGWSHVPGTNP